VQLLELGQPGAGVGPPVLERHLAQPGGHVRVAGDVPGVQQPERDLEVSAGHASCLRDRAHGVIEVRAGIPHRVPDPVRDLRDVVAAVMQHQHVEVAARQQFLAAVAADRDQGDARLGAEHPGQPAVSFRRPPAAISRERSHHVHQIPRMISTRPAGSGPRSRYWSLLDGVVPALSGAHPYDGLDRHGPHLAVADPAGLGRLGDDVDEVFHVFVVANDLDPHLGDKVDLVFGTSVHLGVPALPAVSARFTDCHAVHAERLQRRLDLVEFEGLDDSRNEPHVITLSFTTPDNALAAFPATSRNVSGR
jgi:hypothetical protein